jgi:hypothetical protein
MIARDGPAEAGHYRNTDGPDEIPAARRSRGLSRSRHEAGARVTNIFGSVRLQPDRDIQREPIVLSALVGRAVM